VPRGRRSQTTPPTPLSSSTAGTASNLSKVPSPTKSTGSQLTKNAPLIPASAIPPSTPHNQIDTDNRYSCADSQQYLISVAEPVKTNCDHANIAHNNTSLSDRDTNIDFESTTAARNEQLNTMSSLKLSNKHQVNIRDSDASPETRDGDKDYNEEKEFQRASKVGSANWK